MQFKRKVTSGIEHRYAIFRYCFFLKKNKVPIISGKAIIIEYNLQSGSSAIHNGTFFKASCIKTIKALSHRVSMGQSLINNVNKINKTNRI